jgi:hypothetical protein
VDLILEEIPQPAAAVDEAVLQGQAGQSGPMDRVTSMPLVGNMWLVGWLQAPPATAASMSC